jgi:hypothetical protein
MDAGHASSVAPFVGHVFEKDEDSVSDGTSFLDNQETLWSEPQVEQVLTYSGNGSKVLPNLFRQQLILTTSPELPLLWHGSGLNRSRSTGLPLSTRAVRKIQPRTGVR